jgi:hypothetical protein
MLTFSITNRVPVVVHQAHARVGRYLIVEAPSSWIGQWVSPKGDCVDVFRGAPTFQAAARACQSHCNRLNA